MTTTTVDLRAEAAAEVQRLARARALWRDGDGQALVQLEGDAAWILMARRTGLKRALGRRVCLVWRVAFENAAGRVVESRLVPVMIDVGRVLSDPAQRSRASVCALLRDTDASVRARVDADCDEWMTAVERVSAAFASARQSRERGVAAEASSSRSPASQPGLFDRRAEHARLARVAAAAESTQATSERLRAIAGDGAIARQSARLLLVLVP